MARHKQMPGRIYEIIQKDNKEAIVKCTYLCPYCNQETTDTITVPADGFGMLETGGFFEPLDCEHCGKTTDVRFYKGNRR